MEAGKFAEREMFKATYDPYSYPEEIKDLMELYRNVLAFMVGGVRSMIYLLHFVKRLLRSRTPCDVLQKIRDTICSNNTDSLLDTLQQFVPLTDIVSMLGSQGGTDFTGGTHKLKTPHNIPKLHKKFVKLIKVYGTLFDPLHNAIQIGGEIDMVSLEILKKTLENLDYASAKRFVDFRPEHNKVKLNYHIWSDIADLDTGVLKLKKIELKSITNEMSGKIPGAKPKTIGLVEWTAWSELSKQKLNPTELKKRFTNIIKVGLQKVYSSLKRQNNAQLKLGDTAVNSTEDLQTCPAVDDSSTIPIGKKTSECEVVEGCIWQLVREGSHHMVCRRGRPQGMIRSAAPEGITQDCGIYEGPCQLFKSMAYFICPANKYNIELVEKFEKFFSEAAVKRFLKTIGTMSAEVFGKNASLTQSIIQIEAELHRIEKEGLQGGGQIPRGRDTYRYIINPKTNRKVKSDSQLGIKIINNYKLYQHK